MSRHALKAKKQLEAYKSAFMRMMRAKEQIERLKSQLLKSPTLSGMPQGNTKHDLSDYAANLEKLIEAERQTIETEGAKMRTAKNLIEQLVGIDNAILSYRYIDFMTFTDIAIKLKLTSNAVYIRHQRALERLKV